MQNQVMKIILVKMLMIFVRIAESTLTIALVQQTAKNVDNRYQNADVVLSVVRIVFIVVVIAQTVGS